LTEEFSKLKYLKDLRGHKIPRGAQAVLVAVYNYTDKSGKNAHPGEKRLADDTGADTRTVRRHVKWLTDNGYLTRVSRGHGGGMASVYNIALPDKTVLLATRQLDKNGQPTGQICPGYRTKLSNLPDKSVPLSDPLPDPGSPDPGSEFSNLESALEARLAEDAKRKQALIKRGEECANEIRQVGIQEYIRRRTG
jgi:hypothetical protein